MFVTTLELDFLPLRCPPYPTVVPIQKHQTEDQDEVERKWDNGTIQSPKLVLKFSQCGHGGKALPTCSLGLLTFPLPTILSPELFLLPDPHPPLFLSLNSVDTCLFQELFQDWEGHFLYGRKSITHQLLR